MKHKLLSLITLLLCAACGGADGQDGQDGQDGTDGQSTVFRTAPIEPGETCATGGSLIEFGIDENQDGLLGDEEVAGATTVCNGVDGTPGSEGAAGADGQDGLDGAPGQDGQDGAPGADGLTTLINISPEQAGPNCVAGGQLIEAGADTDASGTLEPSEVTSSAYICNGEEGIQGPPGQDGQDGQDGADLLLEVINEPPGANCQFGGQRLIAGIDDNQNGALDTAEIDQSLYVCDTGLLLSEPAVSTVFDNHEQCYVFTNNLISTVWDNVSNQLLSGDFSKNGYWKFAPATSDWAASPDQDTATAWGRFVLVAGPRQIVGAPGSYVGHPASSYYVADIDATGTLSNQRSAIFSDGFTGSCHQISTSNDEFLCYDGAGVRHYTVVSGSANLTLNKVVPLSQQPVEINTFGTTFAWDGAYYYFAQDGRSNTSKNYLAYGANGQLQGTYTVAGSGAINSPYFDWSVRRYSTHDGFGFRQEGTVYLGATVNSSSWDSHCFGPPSPYHVAP